MFQNFNINFYLGEDGTTILWERSKEEVMTATLDLTLIHPHDELPNRNSHYHQVVGGEEDFEDHSENSSDCSDSTSSQESSDTLAEKELYGPSSAAETAAMAAATNSPAADASCSKAAGSNICVINSLIASLES